MSKRVVEYDCRCVACAGTGLYVGMAERDGMAVSCSRCKGTGAQHVRIEYEDDTRRQPPPAGITRVLAVNPGIIAAPCITPGGVSLEEWQRAPASAYARGAEMREHTCPAWWYQCADYRKKPEWRECSESLGRSFSQCPSFERKGDCWRRWDSEHAADPATRPAPAAQAAQGEQGE